MRTQPFMLALTGGFLAVLAAIVWAPPAAAQSSQPWMRGSDAYRPNAPGYGEPAGEETNGYPGGRANDAYSPRYGTPAQRYDDAYRPPSSNQGYGPTYGAPRGYGDGYSSQGSGNYAQGWGSPGQWEARPPGQVYGEPYRAPGQPYGDPYSPPPGAGYGDPYRGYSQPGGYDRPYSPRPYNDDNGTYSMAEIRDAGHRFFGSISQGLASVIEYAFQRQGRPNGYILGEDLGGAFIAGLRYGEGTLYTKDAGIHKVYWQGPSLGYDAGAEGSKVMVLVYNLSDPSDIYQRFAGVAGAAYFVGGVGITFQKKDDIVVAPIRAGIGLRFGANVGYLKYTPTPTWNPF
jgi:hypothetical protein